MHVTRLKKWTYAIFAKVAYNYSDGDLHVLYLLHVYLGASGKGKLSTHGL